MKTYDVIIIGGGSAGMAAAIECAERGLSDILILERDGELGGILQQCIHNGFGLHMFGEELSGPAYAERFIDMVRQRRIRVYCNTFVLHLSGEREVTYVNTTQGYVRIRGRSVILAMGCRERTRGAIGIPGTRPAGIWSAGTAQRYLNLEGYLVGRRVFILGSGDIGLIMARRMTLEGAKVLGVAELMPYSNGLARNIRQCLDDFDIPLFLSHTITNIYGKDRVEAVEMSRVDGAARPIPGTGRQFAVDTLLLSVGLIPENALSEEAGVILDPKTKGARVDETLETSIPGIFACGNVLHVHDLVDFVSMEGKRAGGYAADYVQNTARSARPKAEKIPVTPGAGVSYVLPQLLCPEKLEKDCEFMFRSTAVYKDARIQVYRGDTLIREVKRRAILPAEMQKISLSGDALTDGSGEVRICVAH